MTLDISAQLLITIGRFVVENCNVSAVAGKSAD